MNNINNNITALYVHIPFCNKICTYCDFFKMVAKTKYKTEYVKHLVKEIYLKIDSFSNLKTIYIGGGTPSALPINILDYFLFHLTRNIDMTKIIEFTIEANPVDVTDEFVKILIKYNINRVSLGVQSFNNEKLAFLGREHSEDQAINAINLLRSGGVSNINVDIIYATPNDTFKIVKKDILLALKLKATHISTYSLILEEKTVLYHMYLKKQFKEFDEDEEFNIYTKIRKLLKKHKFHHYETSNFALKNYESKHNRVYWSNNHYIGLGAGASYYIDNTRYTNTKNINEYYEGINCGELRYFEVEELSESDRMQEEIILGLRLLSGISLIDFKNKFNKDILDVYPFVNELISKKLLKITKNNHLIIPKNKLYLSNLVLKYFI